MIKEDAVICLTVSGAMTPVGIGGIIQTLIERGFVDWNLTSNVGQTISSGLYMFSVQDSKGEVQTGKFVIIK